MIEKLVRPIADFIRFQKGKIGLALLAALVFLVFLFPYKDLSNLVTSTLAKNYQVYLQFDDMSVGVIPPLTLSMDRVKVQAGRSQAFSADHLVISPSLTGLITMSPGGSADAKGMFGGDAAVALKNTNNDPEAGINEWSFDIDASNIDISQTQDLITLPVQLDGRLSAKANGLADLNFKEQPNIDFTLSGKGLRLPPATIEHPQMGPVNVPGFDWASLEIKGRVVGGKLIIEEGRLGAPTDALSARFKGQISMQLTSVRGSVVPRFGAYELRLELLATPAAQQEAIVRTLLGFFDKYKRPASNGSKYLMKVSGRSFAEQNMAPLSSLN